MFTGGVHIGARALLDPKLIWFGYISLAYPSGEEGGNLLVQMISTCRHGPRGRGDGVGTLWCYLDMREESVAQPLSLTRPLHQARNVCHVQEGRNLVITLGCGVAQW